MQFAFTQSQFSAFSTPEFWATMNHDGADKLTKTWTQNQWNSFTAWQYTHGKALGFGSIITKDYRSGGIVGIQRSGIASMGATPWHVRVDEAAKRLGYPAGGIAQAQGLVSVPYRTATQAQPQPVRTRQAARAIPHFRPAFT
jgi:hypothetical protein